jgi:hypothetical protein
MKTLLRVVVIAIAVLAIAIGVGILYTAFRLSPDDIVVPQKGKTPAITRDGRYDLTSCPMGEDKVHRARCTGGGGCVCKLPNP